MIADVFQLPQIVGCNDGGQKASRSSVSFAKVTLDRLGAVTGSRAIKGLIAKQILCPCADTAQDGNLLFHALGKGIDLAVFLKSEAL
ncbi:MAG: hypothetical protein ACLUD2_18775 [Clostridium sp.]